jgi:hypothetical protein
MSNSWTLTVRNGSVVERLSRDSLAASIDAMKQRLSELEPDVREDASGLFKRQFDPVRRVVVRAEIAGPGGRRSATHGGVDLRGDGSVEAYTGRFRRSLVPLEGDESQYDGLLRALSATPPS